MQADVWSVTSWAELRRDAVEIDRHNLLHPEAEPRVPYVTQVLAEAAGPGRRGDRLDARGAGPDPPVGAHATWSRWARTGSASPTPGRRPGATSWSTPSRSWSAPWPRLAARGEVDPQQVVEAARKYRIDDVTAAGPQTSDPGVA